MKLAIYTVATTGYAHALETQARRIVQALSVNTHKVTDLLVIVVTDNQKEVQSALSFYSDALPFASVECIENKKYNLGLENYKEDAQLLIAQMRTAACLRAIGWGADYCLSLDSDVLPPSNSIRCMLDMLLFDNGYYGVSFCPYPSHGGGPFLGGRGTPQQPILPCFYPEERKLKRGILHKMKLLCKDHKKNEVAIKALDEEIKSSPLKGNVFYLNSKKWKKRGWFDNAYPAIGKGAIVPVDWIGCGCTMMNKEALGLCDWTGYDGRGTEDLYINFRRWHPANILIACIPHCPCDHVVRKSKNKTGEYVHIVTGHETSGECQGHLRQWHIPWFSHAAGEKITKGNDGIINRDYEKKEA